MLIRWLWDKILNFFYDLTYHIGTFFLAILKVLYNVFEIFAGTKQVTYHGSDDYLINIFFTDNTVTTLYAGMALIGIVILVVATIIAVAKKSIDVDDKMQASMGQILRKMLSSFLLIVGMNAILIVTINFSNTLMQSIEYLFDNAKIIASNSSITFTNKQYAAMARIYNTIGNYSLNPSYNSRYNINSCFNDIRADLTMLSETGVFNFNYTERTEDSTISSWQSVLTQIANAHSVDEDMPLDEYDRTLSDAILNAMEFAKRNNNEMTVLQSYSSPTNTAATTNASIDRIMFLCGTTKAAKNGRYNGGSVSFSDPIRGQYLTGAKDLYNIDQVKQDFSLAFGTYDHLVIIIGGIILCKEFFALAINCVARIFNMLLLYLIAPPFIALAPLDDGAKLKQWKTAFIVQCFNVFGTVISIRLLLLLFPIIFDSQLILLGSGFTEILAKVLLLLGAVYTARNANGLISGILAENAGYQSIMAGDAASSFRRSGFGKAYDAAFGAAESLGAGVLKGGFNVGKSVIKTPFSLAKAAIGKITGVGDEGGGNDGGSGNGGSGNGGGEGGNGNGGGEGNQPGNEPANQKGAADDGNTPGGNGGNTPGGNGGNTPGGNGGNAPGGFRGFFSRLFGRGGGQSSNGDSSEGIEMQNLNSEGRLAGSENNPENQQNNGPQNEGGDFPQGSIPGPQEKAQEPPITFYRNGSNL